MFLPVWGERTHLGRHDALESPSLVKVYNLTVMGAWAHHLLPNQGVHPHRRWRAGIGLAHPQVLPQELDDGRVFEEIALATEVTLDAEGIQLFLEHLTALGG